MGSCDKQETGAKSTNKNSQAVELSKRVLQRQHILNMNIISEDYIVFTVKDFASAIEFIWMTI